MRTIKYIATLICGVALFTACNQPNEQPAEKETIIVKEDREETPVIVEEDKEGVDIKLGTDEEGKVDVEVEGSIKDDN